MIIRGRRLLQNLMKEYESETKQFSYSNFLHYYLAYKQYGFRTGILVQCTIGRTRHVTSPIWSRIDSLTGPKIRIVGLSFAELEMDKTVHLELYLPLFGRSKHQFR